MTTPGHARDADGRVSCMRIDAAGKRWGWCGIRHVYDDTAKAHTRSLNREWRLTDTGWIVVPATVADGTRP